MKLVPMPDYFKQFPILTQLHRNFDSLRKGSRFQNEQGRASNM